MRTPDGNTGDGAKRRCQYTVEGASATPTAEIAPAVFLGFTFSGVLLSRLGGGIILISFLKNETTVIISFITMKNEYSSSLSHFQWTAM